MIVQLFDRLVAPIEWQHDREYWEIVDDAGVRVTFAGVELWPTEAAAIDAVAHMES